MNRAPTLGRFTWWRFGTQIFLVVVPIPWIVTDVAVNVVVLFAAPYYSFEIISLPVGQARPLQGSPCFPGNPRLKRSNEPTDRTSLRLPEFGGGALLLVRRHSPMQVNYSMDVIWHHHERVQFNAGKFARKV